MRDGRFLVIALFVLFALVVTAGAQEDGVSLSGSFGGDATFLPAFESTFWIDLSLAFDEVTVISETDLVLVPAASGTQLFGLEYTWEWLTLGSEVDLGLLPPAFQSLSVYGEASLLDTTLGEEEPSLSLAADLGVITEILPTFAGTITFGLAAEFGPLAATSTTELGFAPLAFQSQVFEGELSFLDAILGEGEDAPTLIGTLGATFTVFPTFASGLWLNLSLAIDDLTVTSQTGFELVPAGTGTQLFTVEYVLEGVTFTSETTFGLVPFGFESQQFEIEVGFENLSFYVWGTFTQAAGLTAGAGFTYDLP